MQLYKGKVVAAKLSKQEQRGELEGFVLLYFIYFFFATEPTFFLMGQSNRFIQRDISFNMESSYVCGVGEPEVWGKIGRVTKIGMANPKILSVSRAVLF